MDKLKELEKQVELYEKNIESQQQSLETLKRELEQLKAEKESRTWRPKHGDYYWFVDCDGVVHKTEWNLFGIHKQRYLIGNVFKTKEEAEFRAEQLKVEAELRRFGRKFVPKRENYYFTYTHRQESLFIAGIHNYQGNDIYFETAEIAQKAIETVGAERIKKYYFGING